MATQWLVRNDIAFLPIFRALPELRRSTEISARLPLPLSPSRGDSGTREERRYDIAALVKAARCRKILKLKILNGDIRVRDIGGRQLSCSWWRRRGEGGGGKRERERRRKGRVSAASRRSRGKRGEKGGGGGRTKTEEIEAEGEAERRSGAILSRDCGTLLL